MIDVVVFVLSLIVTFSLLASVAAYVAATWVYPSKTESKIVRVSVWTTIIDTFTSAAGTPLGAVTTFLAYFATNVAALLMLVLCFYVSVNMTGSESVFLTDFDGTYLDLKKTLFDGLLNPVIAGVNVVFTSVLPLTNYLTSNISIMVQATLKVLGSSAQDPFVIFRAIAAVPNIFKELIKAFGGLVSQQDGGSIRSNEFNMEPAIQVLQKDVFAAIANQADFACKSVTPVVIVARDIMTSPRLRCTIDRLVNTLVHGVQGLVDLVDGSEKMPFKKHFNALRGAANCFGALLDEVIESVINLMALPALNFLNVKLPGPSLGSAIGRGLAAAVSVLEIIVGGVAEIRSFDSYQKLYIALGSNPFRREAHLAVLNTAAGLDQFLELMHSGTIGKKAYLRCDYWGYNFFADENVMASIPQVCICHTGGCGKGTCVSTGVCECQAGYHHAIPGAQVSMCVPRCTDDDSCIAGRCITDTGYCACKESAVYDLSKGTCNNDKTQVADNNRHDADPEQIPKESWANSKCRGLLTHQMDRPLPCTVQAAGLTILGTLVVGYEFVIDVIFNEILDNTMNIVTRLPRLAQTYDGVWYPRFDSVSCTYRRDKSATYDRTMLRANCRCDPPGENEDSSNYDPYCARPTLNANVYANMDRFAFYAGRNLPIQGVSQLQYVFVGGTGAQFGFLSDTVGAWASASARSMTESWRVKTHIIAGLFTFVESTGAAVMFSGRNLLQKPNNCDWGIEFNGPVSPKYTGPTTKEFFQNKTAEFPLWNPCKKNVHCTAAVRSRISILTKADVQWSKNNDNYIVHLNRMHETQVVYERNLETHEGHGATCSRREYTSNAPFCDTTNDSNECMCNPLFELTEKCLCIAFYPQKQAYSANMSGSYKSTFMAAFYGSSMPWCHSMLLEWSNFNEMSTSVGLQNIWSRMAMGNPFADEIKSDCFDESQTYNISPYSLLTRLFQPNPEGEGFVAVGNNMIPPRDLAICQALRRSKEIRWYKDNKDNIGVTFASHGRCFAKNHKEDRCLEGGYDLRQLALLGFPNPYLPQQPLLCYQTAVFEGATVGDVSVGKLVPPIRTELVTQAITTGRFNGNQQDFCEAALAGTLTSQDLPGIRQSLFGGWINVSEYRKKLEGFKIGQGIALLHPITCGQVARSESLVFQPCRMSCETSSGIDMCWCKNIVHNDFRCNIGNMQREFKWNAINRARRDTTNKISILGMIPNGIVIDNIRSLCDEDRYHGHKVAIAVDAILSPTLDGRWGAAQDLRVKLARVLFNIYEYTNNVETYKAQAKLSLITSLVANAISSALGDTSKRCASGRNMCRTCKEHVECYANPSDKTYCYPDKQCPKEKCCKYGVKDSLEFDTRIWIGAKVYYLDIEATVLGISPTPVPTVATVLMPGSAPVPAPITYDIKFANNTRALGVAAQQLGVKRTKKTYPLAWPLRYFTPDCSENMWTISVLNKPGLCYSKNYNCQELSHCTPPVCAQEKAGCSSVLTDAGKMWAQDKTSE